MENEFWCDECCQHKEREDFDFYDEDFANVCRDCQDDQDAEEEE